MSTPPALPPDTAAPDTLARQVRLYRTLALCLAALLLMGGGGFFYLRRLGQPVTIFVGDKPIGTVRNAATANALIAAAEKSKLGAAFANEEPVRMQTVRLRAASGDAPQNPDQSVRDRLGQALTLHVHACVILVDGHPSLALPTREEAAEALRRVKDHWADLPPVAPPQGAPEFLEKVSIERRAVDIRQTRPSAEAAASYFWTPPPARTYIIRRGDLGSRIASRNHLSLSELSAANPNINLNRLRPGNVLHIQKSPRLLTVRVRKIVVVNEKIQPSAPASEAGRQRVTYLITYLNGREASREARGVQVIEKPKMHLSL